MPDLLPLTMTVSAVVIVAISCPSPSESKKSPLIPDPRVGHRMITRGAAPSSSQIS